MTNRKIKTILRSMGKHSQRFSLSLCMQTDSSGLRCILVKKENQNEKFKEYLKNKHKKKH